MMTAAATMQPANAALDESPYIYDEIVRLPHSKIQVNIGYAGEVGTTTGLVPKAGFWWQGGQEDGIPVVLRIGADGQMEKFQLDADPGYIGGLHIDNQTGARTISTQLDSVLQRKER